jgi:hypothetical protein
VPRTHGRLYDKWTLPDWLDVPVERHGELSRILTWLKATLDIKVRRASKCPFSLIFVNKFFYLLVGTSFYFPDKAYMTFAKLLVKERLQSSEHACYYPCHPQV